MGLNLSYGLAGASIVPILFYLIAFSTGYWTTYNLYDEFGNPTSMHSGLFKNSNSASDNGNDACHGSNAAGGSMCDKWKTAQAFVIMALIIVSVAAALSAMSKAVPAGASFGVSGIFGMIGWAIYYGGIQQSYSAQSGTGYSIGNYSIGYSQALVIVAWSFTLLLAVGSFFNKPQ